MSGCRHYDAGRCRSCSLMSTSLEQQHADKAEHLKLITGLTPEPLVAGPAWHFRDKVKLSVTGTIENPIIGLLQEDLAHAVELLDCPVQAEILNRELPTLKDFITRWRLTPYDIPKRTGELKGLILSLSPTTGEKMLRFVLRSKEALDRLRQGLPELSAFQVVSVNLQPIPHALLEGPEEIILSTQQTLKHKANDVLLHFSPQSFMQTNSVVAQQLYATAVEWLAPWRGEKVLDLFCGVGGFALHLAQSGHEVHGVEINAAAVTNAEMSARELGLKATFTASPAEKVSALWNEWNPNVVVVNPPRRGLGPSLDLIEHMKPAILLYSSCSPESLATDLKALELSYFATRSKVFDMFPYTHHFESLTLLVRR
jgi:23S rRNA (uracil747-C5)-methyltransferase